MHAAKPSVSAQKKLQLVRQIREEHRMNQNMVRGREELLYGRKYYEPLRESEQIMEIQDGTVPISTFRLRLAISLLLFGLLFIMQQKERTLFGMTSSQICSAVEKDDTVILFDFIDEIPYTLHE